MGRRGRRRRGVSAAPHLGDNLNELLSEADTSEAASIHEAQAADAVFADATIAEQFAAEALAGKFRHATGLGWLRWDGKRWHECGDKDARESARQWVTSQFRMAADAWKEATTGGRTQEAERLGRRLQDQEELPVRHVWATRPELLARKIAYMADLARVYDPDASRWLTWGGKGSHLTDVNQLGA